MRPQEPFLALVAVHLTSMWALPIYFLRVRQLERRARAQGGRPHRWISRRSLLLTTWWGGEEEARAWLASPEVQAILARSGRGPVAGAWAHAYRLWGL